MKTFIVNLKRSLDRREYMQKLLKDFPYEWEFFEAVDGLEIKNLFEMYSEKWAKLLYGKGLTRGEVGCALSHLGIYKKMIDENIDKALILEDDVILQKDFYAVLEKLKDIKLNNDIILLGQSDKKIRKSFWSQKIYKSYKIYRIVSSGYGAYAYIIDIKAAKKVLFLNYPVKMPADAWRYFYNYINIYTVEPNVAVPPIRDEGQSSIDAITNRTKYKPISFKDELKANFSIFGFLMIVIRKTFSLVKIRIERLKFFSIEFYPKAD